MTSNLHDYFEKAKNFPLKKKVEEWLEASDIDLVEVFNKAKYLTLQEAARKPLNYKGRNYMAESMYGNVIGILTDNFSQYMKTDSNNRPYISFENVRIYIKKLSEKYIPSNIKTKSVKKMNAQELFDQEEQIHVVYAGFVLSKNDWFVDFKETCVSYLNKVYNKSVAWVLNLREERFRKNSSILTYLDNSPVDETPLVFVPKNNAKKSGTDS